MREIKIVPILIAAFILTTLFAALNMATGQIKQDEFLPDWNESLRYEPGYHYEHNGKGYLKIGSPVMVIYEKYDPDTMLTVPWCDTKGCQVIRTVSSKMDKMSVPLKTDNKLSSELIYDKNTEYSNYYPIGTILEFGEHSTEIRINTSDDYLGTCHMAYLDDGTPQYDLYCDYTTFYVGMWFRDVGGASWNYTYRSFMGFDTSSIPNGATIDDAKLYIHHYAQSFDTENHNNSFDIYYCDFGTSTETGDWDSYLNGDLVPGTGERILTGVKNSVTPGELYNRTYLATPPTGEYHHIDVETSNISTTGRSSFCLKAGNETIGGNDDKTGNHYYRDWSENATNGREPYLLINYTSAVSSEIYNVSLQAPKNGHRTTDTTPWATVYASGNNADYACYLYFNDTAYDFDGGVVNVTDTNLTSNTSLSTGNYTVYFNCTDGTNTNQSNTIEIEIYTSCTEVLMNTTAVNHANISCNTTNNLTLNWSWTEYDQNGCGFTNISWYNYTWETCDYCQYNITNSTTTDTNTTVILTNGTCNSSSVLSYQMHNWTQWVYFIQFDTNQSTCCAVTGLSSDCFTNITWETNTSWGNYTYNVNCTYSATTSTGAAGGGGIAEEIVKVIADYQWEIWQIIFAIVMILIIAWVVTR